MMKVYPFIGRFAAGLVRFVLPFLCTLPLAGQCLNPELAVINSCIEHPNPGGGPLNVESEILVVSSGLVPVNVADAGVDLPFNGFGAANADISAEPGDCPFKFPTVTALPGCPGAIPLGPNDVIPAGAIVVIFVTGTTISADILDVDFSNICPNGQPVYILQSSCERTAGAFANGSTGGNPLRTIGVTSPCGVRAFTYNTQEINPADGTYYLVGANAVGNLDCDLPTIPETCPAIDLTYYICDPAGALAPVPATDLASIYPLSDVSVSFFPTATAAETNTGRITQYQPAGMATDTLYARIIYATNFCIVVRPLIIRYQTGPAQSTAPAAPLPGCADEGMGLFDLRRLDAEIGGGQPVTYYTDAAGNSPVTDPGNYAGPAGTLFARAGEGSCAGAIVPVELVLVDQPALSPVATPTTCPENTDGIVALNPSGNGPFSFAWAGDTLPASATLTDLPAGDYTATVRDVNGCSSAASATVLAGPALTLSCGLGAPASGPAQSDGVATLTITQGRPPYTVTYSGAAAGAVQFPTAMGDVAGLPPGDYTFVATDANGCTSTDCSLTIGVAFPIDLMCFVRNNSNGSTILGAIRIELSGGVPPFLVELTDQNNNTSSFPNRPAGTQVFPNLPVGTYTITVTDAQGQETSCTRSIVLDNCPLTVTNVQLLASDCSGADNVIIRLSLAGNSGAIATVWSGGNNIEQFNGQQEAGPLPPGDYFVQVSDQSACPPIFQGPITVTNPGPVVWTNSSSGQSNPCTPDGLIEATVQSGGTPPYTIRLRDEDSGTELANFPNVTAGQTVQFTNLEGSATGRNYAVFVTDALGCPTPLAPYTITSLPAPAITFLPAGQMITAPTCTDGTDGSLTIAASGGTAPYTYRWIDYPERSLGRVLADGPSQTNLPAGDYQIEVRDGLGCLDTLVLNVPAGSSPTLACGPATDAIGPTGGTVEVDLAGGSGPYVLTLTRLGENLVFPNLPAGTTLISDLPGGDYSGRITDAAGCTSLPCTFSVGFTPCQLGATAITVPADCAGPGEIAVTVTGALGAVSLAWADPTFPAATVVMPVDSGAYFVSITDAAGCQLDTFFRVGRVDDAPALLNVGATPLELCLTDTFQIDLDFGGTPPFVLSYELQFTDRPAQPGMQTFNGSQGSLRIDAAQIPGDSALLVITELADARCRTTVMAPATALKFVRPDTIRRFDITCDPSPLDIGGRLFDATMPSDTFMVDDGSLCGLRYEVDLTFEAPEVPDTSLVFICPGTQYIVAATQDTFDASRPEGRVVYPRPGACDSIVYVRLDIPPVFVGSFSTGACAGDTVFYGDRFFTAENSNGLARLVGQASTGCDSLVAVNVIFTRVGELRLLGNHRICRGDSILLRFAYDGPGRIDARLADTQGNVYNFNGLGNGSREMLFPTVSTTYRILSANVGMCPGEFQGSSTVTINDLDLTTEVLLDPAAFCFDTLGKVAVYPSGGTEPYAIRWSNGRSDSINRNLLAGTYAVTVEDADGCQVIDSLVLNERQALTAAVTALPPDCPGGTGKIRIDTLYGGGGFYEVSLDGSFFIAADRVGDFNPPEGLGRLLIQDVDDCALQLDFFVPGPLLPELSLPEDTLIFLGDSLLLDPQVSVEVDSAWWSPPLGLRTPNRATTLAAPTQSTDYLLNLITASGCRLSQLVSVQVDERVPIYAPTAFSPNGDGTNDTYRLELGARVAEVLSFRIYNRWGHLVFEGLDGWDGITNGARAPAAVYVFTATVRLSDGSERALRGDFVLMR
ncbi:gliding motility-associated C-terminal domain-containing protein [Neolewinella lacunae]|uniref:Gliding motility-associated C-terminal domain-containing protein n=1 Tax=Neolewinella lacunae TaxID=1517758 RepID=A0A923PLU7_9BACT|nr:gliding motility-associated C-terminal domain-containing protein [Neolewinella lacunae]MBC6993664.1 gliding motility-associated C-terminal domain-containing protein [Neolewinella lacunae]MDN3636359.1 gliding motility-associated C-terminal domain-containing protein [Neolewinella lacunae]